MNDVDDVPDEPSGEDATPYEVIKWRLYDGEFEAVAEEALGGELDFGAEHSDAWELVGRAIEHHLGALFRSSDDPMAIQSQQHFGDLVLKIVWPSAQIVNQVRLEIAADHVKLDPYFLSRAEIRNSDPADVNTLTTERDGPAEGVSAASAVRRLFQGSGLVDESSIVLRPITDASRVVVSAIPGHRYDFGKRGRFDWGPWCPAPSTMARQAAIDIEALPEPAPEALGNYAVAREGTRVYELVDPDEAYRQRMEEQRELRRTELLTVAYSLGIVAAGSLVVRIAAELAGL